MFPVVFPVRLRLEQRCLLGLASPVTSVLFVTYLVPLLFAVLYSLKVLM